MMSLRLDRTGELARIECDLCGAPSDVHLRGTPRLGDYFCARVWLRARLSCLGWTWVRFAGSPAKQAYDRCPDCSDPE